MTILNPVEAAEEPILNVYNWSDYIDPEAVTAFEKEFGIKVNYDTYDSPEMVEARLLAGKSGFDVIIHDYSYAARLIRIGVFKPLDFDRLPLRGNIDPWLLESMDTRDPGGRHGVPYMWGSTGFAYNPDLVEKHFPGAPVDSGAMLFDPEVVEKLAPCGVTWVDSPTDVLPMALVYLGYDPNTQDPIELAEVEALLQAVRPHIRYFGSARMLNDLPNGEICVAMSWSGDYATALMRAQESGVDIRLAYTQPIEGSMLWAEGMFIPADAPHPDNAHRFINFLLRPEVAAGITNFIHYANGNAAANPLIEPEVFSDPAIYPPPEMRERLQLSIRFDPKAERQRTRMWSRIKTGL